MRIERGRTGAEAICDALEAEGVDILFGHPGGAVLPLYDELHRRPRLRHVLVRHEQAASHAADGYARASGRTGVCLATSGPGATNLITGLATAMMDCVPVVALTGQVPTGVLGTDAFQETDILGVTIAVTKHGFQIRSADEIEDVMAEAFRLARSGRPGPVLVDLPKDIQAGREEAGRGVRWHDASERAAAAGHEASEGAAAADEAGAAAAAEVAAHVVRARRPLLMVGRGMVLAGMSDLLRELAEAHDLPVVTTLLGIDAFPSCHPLALGMPGMHGTARANRAIQEADLIVGLGLRFDDRVTGPVSTFAPHAVIALFEVDAGAVGRTVQPDITVIGDLRDTLPLLRDRLRGRVREEWWGRLREWTTETDPDGASGSPPAAPDDPPGGREAARALARAINAQGAIVTTDVGQHQMWMAQELQDCNPRTHLTSGGLGAMGYALPAAMGAALGCPEKEVWSVSGDGGFQMTMQELATVVQESIPLRIVILNNGYLGMVRQWQELFFEARFSQSRLAGPDLAALAAAFGIPALTVVRRSDLVPTIEAAAAERGPVLLDIQVPAEDLVYPLVPPGAALHEMVERSTGLSAAPVTTTATPPAASPPAARKSNVILREGEP